MHRSNKTLIGFTASLLVSSTVIMFTDYFIIGVFFGLTGAFLTFGWVLGLFE